MGLFPKKEFAELCGITTRELAVYIKREKVLVDSNQMIDGSVQQNSDFMARYKDRKRVPSSKTGNTKKPPATKPPKSKAEDKQEKENRETLYQLEKQRKAMDLEKKSNEINLQRMEIAKKQGELVPTSLIKSLIIHHSEAMRLHYNQATENLINIYNSITRLTADQQAEIKTKMDLNVNETIDKIIVTSTKGLKNIALEYSERRGVGQHD